MVVITLVDIKYRQDKLIFILDQLLEKLNIVRIPEVVSSKHVDLIHEVLFFLRQGALGSLQVGSEGLRQWSELVRELDVCNYTIYVSVENLLDIYVFFENECFDYACRLLI